MRFPLTTLRNSLLSVLVAFSWAAQGEKMVVQFHSARGAEAALQGFSRAEVLMPALNIYLVDAHKSQFRILSANPSVRRMFEDYAVDLRATKGPNDPSIDKQWGLQKISAANAWKISSGGPDKAGREIVVAVVDGGFDVTHSDLKDNVWVNPGEIPGNSKDDDGNGYIDDINGWDVYTNSGKMEANRHATHVAGIVGAAGNNANGIAGVSWNNKVVSIHGGGAIYISNMVKAYDYVSQLKKQWLQTNGKLGANIVVNNSSFGVDLKSCKDQKYAVWNDMLNAMGELGILSVGATANNDVDVDTAGDIPSTCDSPYLITVTNTDESDQKSSRAAWGIASVDLAGPGNQILSSIPGNTYGTLSGTSMAAPHVSGTIALMYSAASKALVDASAQSPKAAALIVKDLLLRSVDPIAAMNGKSVSGGRLNSANAVRAAATYK